MDHATLALVGGTLAHKVVSTAIGAPIKGLLRQATSLRASEMLDRVYQQQVEEIALEWPVHLERLAEAFATSNRDLGAILEGKLDERAATVLFLRLLDEAIESATHERLSLMCAGLAGTFNPDLDVETKSRVARAVALLEPSDIDVLRVFAGSAYARNALPKPISEETLLRAGCIVAETKLVERPDPSAIDEENPRNIPKLHERRAITELGRAVLVFLSTHESVQTVA